MFETVGYVVISAKAEIVSAAPDKDFQGQTLRVMEFATDGGAMVVNNDGNALAVIEPADIKASFKCAVVNNLVICDPNLNLVEQMVYYAKATSRKGGYNHMVKAMVIAASLHRKEFCDSVLWQKQ